MIMGVASIFKKVANLDIARNQRSCFIAEISELMRSLLYTKVSSKKSKGKGLKWQKLK